MEVQNLHVLRVKYLSATDTKGSRVKIISDRFEQSITFPYNYELNNIEHMAIAVLKARGTKHNIIGKADGYIITDTFEPLK